MGGRGAPLRLLLRLDQPFNTAYGLWSPRSGTGAVPPQVHLGQQLVALPHQGPDVVEGLEAAALQQLVAGYALVDDDVLREVPGVRFREAGELAREFLRSSAKKKRDISHDMYQAKVSRGRLP
ncbi:hypothetical protein ColKHC_06416 [Colletotrichum higginsianum]|nr:hypothetical protein ColKHC_06416 [Colletotrichum higginsianum]